MLIKKPSIEIDKVNPFKEDILDRSKSAAILSELLKSVDEPFVLAIDSKWGTGKTTFVKMWKQTLENEGVHCLYFNAWENDFSDDPLISFIAEMQNGIETLTTGGSKAKEYFEKTKKAGASLVKRIVPVAVKMVTAGALDVEDELSGFFAKMAQEKIDKYEADKSSIREFRENLGKCVHEIEGEKRPLVFFVDELDRCRPIYAISLLERIKHLFDVTGLVFILAIDKDQISHSIRALYGIGMDVDGYLRRFIDLDYKMPEASTELYGHYLFKTFDFDEFFGKRRDGLTDRENLLNVFIELSKSFHFSLRVQEQCFTRFSIVLRTSPENQQIFPFLVATLIALKAAETSLYEDFVSGKVSSHKVVEYIQNTPEGAAFLNKRLGQIVQACVIASPLEADDLDQVIKEYEFLANKSGGSEKVRIEEIKGFLQMLKKFGHFNILKLVVGKIEVAESFVS